ncbi:MAG: alanine racemase [Treponema sp.]|jgi:alanine racemase|nr:alanine racemase [Treponema sp.]
MRATRAIIHTDHFISNLETIRRKVGPHPAICAAVKADAYGHGASAMSRLALEAGASCLAVATVSEGAELRKQGIKAKILLLSQALPEEINEIAELYLTPLLGDRESLAAFQACVSAPLEVHLKVDTGMGRLGCRPEEAAELAVFIRENNRLRLGGMATHLSVADYTNAENLAYTKKQIELFRKAVESVRDAGVDTGLVHAANSGAICFHEESYFDMVRPGIFLYGYSPAASYPGGLIAKPVMELRSAITFIKKVRAGEEISYSRTWKAEEDTYIGTLPIGYADGLPRRLSNNHSVLIRGKPYPLVGRFCMDQCMVNLGPGGEVQRWDEAVIFGPGFETAEDIARKIGAISYEILCYVNKRVPRVYSP